MYKTELITNITISYERQIASNYRLKATEIFFDCIDSCSVYTAWLIHKICVYTTQKVACTQQLIQAGFCSSLLIFFVEKSLGEVRHFYIGILLNTSTTIRYQNLYVFLGFNMRFRPLKRPHKWPSNPFSSVVKRNVA